MKSLVSALRARFWMWQLARHHKNPARSAGSSDRLIANLQECLTPFARDAWRSLICKKQPRLDWKARIFFTQASAPAIGEAVWQKLLDGLVRAASIRIRKVEITGQNTEVHDFGAHSIQTQFVAGILSHNETASASVGAAVQDGYLTCRSPTDGKPLRSDASLVLTPHLIAYRFVDRTHDLVFYVVSPVLGWAQVRAVLFPSLEVCFVHHGWHDRFFTDVFGAPLEDLMVKHVFGRGAEIEAYLRRPSRDPALIFIQGNIAHHLWNEIGEIDRLCEAGVQLPQVLLVEGSNAEYFGAIDELYPDLAGKVVRGIRWGEVSDLAYRRGLCVFGPSNKYVSERLRSRLLKYNERLSGLEEAKAQHGELARNEVPIVVLGLRPHNRTVDRQAEFLSQLIRGVLQEYGKAVIVFDGWSDKGPADFIDAEKRIVADALRDIDHPKLTIIDMIGRPMRDSLFWIARSQIFVSVYGAGMAKYRWICNKPGLLLTGEWNLKHRADLRIYSEPEFMESPSPMVYISDEHVRDVMDADLMQRPRTHSDGSLANFTVNQEAAFEIVRRLLREHPPAISKERAE